MPTEIDFNVIDSPSVTFSLEDDQSVKFGYESVVVNATSPTVDVDEVSGGFLITVKDIRGTSETLIPSLPQSTTLHLCCGTASEVVE